MVSFKGEPSMPVQQLAILSIARFAEPVALTGVFPYLPEMVESLGVPENEVAQWAGITSAVFSISQCLTCIWWGYASDIYGRKPVVLTCLTCAMMSTLVFGFSSTLRWAIFARILSGISNANVGIVRTMVAELVPYKTLQPRAFSIMPLVWSIGSVFGPILGGTLASPVKKYPHFFGGSTLLRNFPFALPNMVAAAIFTVGVSVAFLFLEETLEAKRGHRDIGLILGDVVMKPWKKRKRASSIDVDHEQGVRLLDGVSDRSTKPFSKAPRSVSYRDVFTYQSNVNLTVYVLLSMHAVAYDQLVPVFLHLPLRDAGLHHDEPSPFLKFSSGFGLDSGRIGLIFTIYGFFCMVTQFALFPYLCRRHGVLGCLRACTFAFPVAYVLTPFAVLLPTPRLREAALFGCMMIKGAAGVFAYPCNTILLTNSARSIAVLGTLNGVAVALSAVAKAAGPYIAGEAFTLGIARGYMVVAWWTLAAFGLLGHASTWWLVEVESPISAAVAAPAKGRGKAGEEIAMTTTTLTTAAATAAAKVPDVEVALVSSAHEDSARVAAARHPLHRGHGSRVSMGRPMQQQQQQQLTALSPAGAALASRMRSPMRTRKDMEAARPP